MACPLLYINAKGTKETPKCINVKKGDKVWQNQYI